MKKFLSIILLFLCVSCINAQITPDKSGVSSVYNGDFSAFTAASTTILKKTETQVNGWYMQFSVGSYTGSNVTVTIKPIASNDGINYFIIPRQLNWIDQYITSIKAVKYYAGLYQYPYVAPFDSSFTISQSQTNSTVYRYGSQFPFSFIGFLVTKTPGAGSKCPFTVSFGYTKEGSALSSGTNNITILNMDNSNIHGTDTVILEEIPQNVKNWSYSIQNGTPVGTHSVYIIPICSNIGIHSYSAIPRFKYSNSNILDSATVVNNIADTIVTLSNLATTPSTKIYQGNFFPCKYVGVHIRKGTAGILPACPINIIFNFEY